MPTALIIGAYSDIGRALALQLAQAGYQLQLAARQAKQRLERCKTDIELRHQSQVSLLELDVTQTAKHADFVANLSPLPDVVICVAGVMHEQQQAQQQEQLALDTINTNYSGLVILFEALAVPMAQRGSGCLVGVSSVAGDRGRQKNYLYGSAKAGVSAYLSGLRNRLFKQGVNVITVKPGFVNTRMTEGMDLPAKLTAEPDEVASAIVNAINKKKSVVYSKPIWRFIMLAIRHIPEFIFKKMDI